MISEMGKIEKSFMEAQTVASKNSFPKIIKIYTLHRFNDCFQISRYVLENKKVL